MLASKKQQPIQIGEVFTKLTVLSKSDRTDKGFRTYWNCKCECGEEKVIRGTCLRHGEIRSCGCLHRHTTGAINRKDPGAVTWTNFRVSYRANAQRKNRSFDLTEEQFKEIAEKNCHYCGSAPRLMNYYLKADNQTKKLGRSRKVNQTQIDASWIKANGIDRIDSTMGYTINNCVPCCSNCNMFKNDLSVDEFLNHVNKIVSFQGV